MLSHLYRFHGHGSLRYVFKNGETVRSRYFTFRYSENRRRTASRFSVSISKKVLKSAVKRNRVRRRIYEVIRLNLSHVDGTHDCVFIVGSPEVLTLPPDELTAAVTRVLADAGMFTDPSTVLK